MNSCILFQWKTNLNYFAKRNISSLTKHTKAPSSYWKSLENRKNFLDKVAKKFNVKTPSDWGNISIRTIWSLGGRGLLLYYQNSVFNCLQSIYKETEWKREWFCKVSNSYWESIENRKKFMDEVAIKLDIKTPKEWRKLTQNYFLEIGGAGLLRYYHNSLFVCLQSIYNDIEWKREWFFKLPKSYWKSLENRRKFLDEIAKKLNIKTPKDWGKVTVPECLALGGSGILKYYNNSLFSCLQAIYKDTKWEKEWFSNIPRFPKTYWDSAESSRKFLDEVAFRSNVVSPNDWRKVSLTLIRKSGGHGLVRKYQGSLMSILKSLYKVDWSEHIFPNKSSSEMIVKNYVHSLFPDAIENCRDHKRFNIKSY